MFIRKGQALGSVHFGRLTELRAERPTKKTAPPPKPEPVAPQPEPEPDEVVEPPKDYATKADWVDWAVECGADRGEAEDLTKAELIELYGKGS